MYPTTSSLLATLSYYTSLWQGELSGIIIPTEHCDKPHFWHTSHGVVVEAIQKGQEVWLTVMPNMYAYHCDTIASRIPQTHSMEILSSANLIPNAMHIAESDGVECGCSIIIQERFLPLNTFIRRNVSKQRCQLLRNALHSIAQHIDLFCDGVITHGALSAHNLGFTSDGSLRIADYPISFLKTERSDCQSLLQCAIMLFIAACSRESHALLTGKYLQHIPSDKLTEYITAAAQYHGADGLAEAASLYVETRDVDSYRRAIQRLASEPFRPLPFLYNALTQYAKLPSVQYHTPDDQEIITDCIDLATCDFVAPPSDLYIRFHKGSSWGYANHRGEIIHTGKRLLYATDFYEGLAVVRTESGYGVINTAGEWVMEDRWVDIIWHGEENIITATEDGKWWHIYNRRGHQISYYPCHGFGTPSEGYIVARFGNKFGYYATNGEKCVDFIYERAGSFNRGFALVCYNGNSYHIDTTFHRIGSVQEQLLAQGRI
ncbi:MAG: WG repeat-containing protein [Tidjanibacter sp.]|nr:WG repeat-containing protein [Tidjanibacter sp.]